MSTENIELTRLVIKHPPTQAEIDAFVQAMDNCFIDTADNDATMVLARNTGTEQVCTVKKEVWRKDSLEWMERLNHIKEK